MDWNDNSKWYRLMWLISRDYAQAGTWNVAKQDWDEGAYPSVTTGVIFGPEVHTESIQDEVDLEVLYAAAVKHGWDGVYAWVAAKRGFDPLELHITIGYTTAYLTVREERARAQWSYNMRTQTRSLVDAAMKRTVPQYIYDATKKQVSMVWQLTDAEAELVTRETLPLTVSYQARVK